VSAEELGRAATLIGPELEGPRRERPPEGVWTLSGIIIMAAAALALLPAVVLSLVSSAIVPGGILTRLLGHAVVNRRGVEIGRMQSLGRALVASAPAIAWLVHLIASPKVQGFVPTPPNPLLGTVVTLAALGLGAAYTIARPTRGPHDWLAGTWVVPR
jgi:hypothetical protein